MARRMLARLTCLLLVLSLAACLGLRIEGLIGERSGAAEKYIGTWEVERDGDKVAFSITADEQGGDGLHLWLKDGGPANIYPRTLNSAEYLLLQDGPVEEGYNLVLVRKIASDAITVSDSKESAELREALAAAGLFEDVGWRRDGGATVLVDRPEGFDLATLFRSEEVVMRRLSSGDEIRQQFLAQENQPAEEPDAEDPATEESAVDEEDPEAAFARLNQNVKEALWKNHAAALLPDDSRIEIAARVAMNLAAAGRSDAEIRPQLDAAWKLIVEQEDLTKAIQAAGAEVKPALARAIAEASSDVLADAVGLKIERYADPLRIISEDARTQIDVIMQAAQDVPSFQDILEVYHVPDGRNIPALVAADLRPEDLALINDIVAAAAGKELSFDALDDFAKGMIDEAEDQLSAIGDALGRLEDPEVALDDKFSQAAAGSKVLLTALIAAGADHKVVEFVSQVAQTMQVVAFAQQAFAAYSTGGVSAAMDLLGSSGAMSGIMGEGAGGSSSTQALNQQLAQINQRLQMIEQRLARIETNVAEMKAAIRRVEERVDAIAIEVHIINQRITEYHNATYNKITQAIEATRAADIRRFLAETDSCLDWRTRKPGQEMSDAKFNTCIANYKTVAESGSRDAIGVLSADPATPILKLVDNLTGDWAEDIRLLRLIAMRVRPDNGDIAAGHFDGLGNAKVWALHAGAYVKLATQWPDKFYGPGASTEIAEVRKVGAEVGTFLNTLRNDWDIPKGVAASLFEKNVAYQGALKVKLDELVTATAFGRTQLSLPADQRASLPAPPPESIGFLRAVAPCGDVKDGRLIDATEIAYEIVPRPMLEIHRGTADPGVGDQKLDLAACYELVWGGGDHTTKIYFLRFIVSALETRFVSQLAVDQSVIKDPAVVTGLITLRLNAENDFYRAGFTDEFAVRWISAFKGEGEFKAADYRSLVETLRKVDKNGARSFNATILMKLVDGLDAPADEVGKEILTSWDQVSKYRMALSEFLELYPEDPALRKQLDIANDYDKLKWFAEELELMTVTNSIGRATAAFLDEGFDGRDPVRLQGPPTPGFTLMCWYLRSEEGINEDWHNQTVNGEVEVDEAAVAKWLEERSKAVDRLCSPDPHRRIATFIDPVLLRLEALEDVK